MSTPKQRKSKRKAPVHNTPPSNLVVNKSKDAPETTANDIECLICDNATLEPGESTDGHDAVFCEGDCQGWIHRHCASLTHPAFSESTPYLCPHCTLAKQSTTKINPLKNAISPSRQPSLKPHNMISSNQQTGPKVQSQSIQRSPDRRCNVVFYMVSQNASKFVRSQSDQDHLKCPRSL